MKALLRNHIRNHIVTEIQQGNLTFSKSLNLARIARAVGASVTPVREALTQLEKVGVVKAIPNTGFVIPKPTVEMIKSLYETIAALEGLAVEGIEYNQSHFELLQKQAVIIADCKDEKLYLDYKFLFHENLIRPSNNNVLKNIIYDLFLRVRFLEHLFHLQLKPLEKVQNKYETLIKSIQEGNLPMASLIIRMNWNSDAKQLEQCVIEGISVRL